MSKITYTFMLATREATETIKKMIGNKFQVSGTYTSGPAYCLDVEGTLDEVEKFHKDNENVLDEMGIEFDSSLVDL
jgi:hypothetical protein